MMNIFLAGGLDFLFVHFIYGMSSFPFTTSYFSRWLKPPTSNISSYITIVYIVYHCIPLYTIVCLPEGISKNILVLSHHCSVNIPKKTN